jgi:hypothetical protein
MKKDIMVVREAITRVVSMLTRQSIKVTQRGSQAYVRYHPKNGTIIELNVPYLPDDASEEFISAVQGFLDHEVGHVLFTDYKVLQAASKAGKRIANVHNILEDVYVERKMSEAFRGSGMNLESTRKFYLEKIARPKIDDAIARGEKDEAQAYASVAAFRGWGGQATALDFVKEPAIAALVLPVAEKLGEELVAAIGACNSSADCLELAKKFVAKLVVPKPPPPPPPPWPLVPRGGSTHRSATGRRSRSCSPPTTTCPPGSNRRDWPSQAPVTPTRSGAWCCGASAPAWWTSAARSCAAAPSTASLWPTPSWPLMGRQPSKP